MLIYHIIAIMKKTLKKILRLFTNNVGLKILSLLLSVMIWLVVVSIDNPVKDQNFTQVPVTVLNGDTFEASGQAYELADSSSTVTVTARAERSVLSQLSRDDFSATIDMNNYSNGRVPISVALDGLDEDALIKIIKEPKNSMIRQYTALFKIDDVNLFFDEDAIREIAKEAFERKTGARGIRSIMEKVMTKVMFEIPSDDTIKECRITKDSILGLSEPIVVRE